MYVGRAVGQSIKNCSVDIDMVPLLPEINMVKGEFFIV